ncbi:MAG: S1 RNA-binding domain-containing protein [Lachnospiraceae bacterium]|nr:S1 RNA-binding domain-containing protein [Lachnospiraceae bacterium]
MEDRKDLEEIVQQEEEDAKAAAEQAEQKAAEQAEKEAADRLMERQKNPHGLIRSTVSNKAEDAALPQETMADFEAELNASFVKVDSQTVRTGEDVNANSLSWEKLKNMMEDETVITGEITEVTKGGAVMVVEGVRGFIPTSRLALTYVEKPDDYLNKTVSVRVIEADEEQDRLILSARELLREEEEKKRKERLNAFKTGDIVTGEVESVRDYGAFVRLAEGVSGLLHISQISAARVKSVRAVLKEGDSVTARITKIEDGKISLSRRVLEEERIEKERADEPKEYSDGGEATTSLGSLLKGLKL